MSFSWKTKKQLTYFGIAAAILILTAGFFIFSGNSKGTCADGNKNQNEEEIDCGGKCDPCPRNLSEPIALWTRFFKKNDKENTYDIAAFVKNPNLEWGSKNLNYSFKLFNQDNILIIEKNGKTFINPGEQFIIFENAINAQKAEPYRATITIEPVKKWQYFAGKLKPQFLITKNKFNRQSSTLETEIKNNSEFDARDIYLTAKLINKDGNVFAVSETKIDSLSAEEKSEAFFTWQKIFSDEPSQIEIIPRINLMDANL